LNKTAQDLVSRFFGWLGSHELSVLVAFAALAGGAWAFSYIASEVHRGDTNSFDRSLLLALRKPDRSPMGGPGLQEAARDITGLGGVTTLSLVTLFTSGYLLLANRRRMALFVAASVVSGLLLSTLLKDAFQRPRPDLVPYGSYVSSTSFPSGHSMLSAVTYLTVGALLARSQQRKRLKAFFLLVAALLSFLVGVSRVYLGFTGRPMCWRAGPPALAGPSSAGWPPCGCRSIKRSKARPTRRPVESKRSTRARAMRSRRRSGPGSVSEAES
jgi:undecaprenyl-diphosphatase